MTDRRRAEDRTAIPSFIAGFLIASAGIGLRILQPTASDVLVIALVLIGGVLMNPWRVLGLVRSWRKNGNGVPPT